MRFPAIAILGLMLGGTAWAQGVITTFAGGNWVFSGNGKAAVNAPLGFVYGVTLDPSGNVVIADRENWLAERINPDGTLSVIAGIGFYFAPVHTGDGGPAVNANIFGNLGVAYDSKGNLYIAETDRISQVSPQGIINTIAGGGSDSTSNGIAASQAAVAPQFGLVVDGAGDVYFSETGNNRVRKLSASGTITTVAGTGTAGFAGDGGLATAAELNAPHALALDSFGNLYIADSNNSALRAVTPAGKISTVISGFPITGVAIDKAGAQYVAGYGAVYKIASGATTAALIAGVQPVSGYAGGFSGDGGPAVGAQFSQVMTVTPDNAGNVYIGDVNNSRVRKVSTSGTVTTIAGNGLFYYTGEGAPALIAPVLSGGGLAIDNTGSLYYSEPGSGRVRKVSGGAINTVAGSGVAGFSGDGGPATAATLFNPRDLAFDAANNLYIADSINQRVRKVAQNGTISTFAQLPGQPFGLVFDASGNLYVSLSGSAAVYRIDPKGNQTVAAGTGTAGFSGDGGPATAAKLNGPAGLAMDAAGNLYIADSVNGLIRKVNPQGTISTVYSLSYSTAGPADLRELAFDAAGNLYVSDETGDVVRKITSAGVQTIFAGGGGPFPGDGMPANQVALYPYGIAADAAGNVYIDDGGHGIEEVLAVPPTVLLPQNTLSFSAASAGAPTTQTLIVAGSVPALAFTASVTTRSGGNWLSVSPASASTPDLLSITADPTNLAPGTYTGTVTIVPVVAAPASLTAAVAFTVGPGLPPQIGVDQPSLSFAYPAGAPARAETLRVSNAGGGALPFTVTATTNTGGSWLTVTPVSGSVSPGTPVPLSVTADPSKLGTGNYTGSILIQSTGGGSITVPVNMGISGLSQALLLTQTGMTFTAVAQGGVVPPQSFGVVNLGTGSLAWTASASTLSGGNWLSATPASGASDPTLAAPQVTVAVNPSGLAAGDYYGLVQIAAPTAANSPQVVSVYLSVLPVGSDPGPSVQPSELFFSAIAGASVADSPPSQQLLVYNIGAAPKTYFVGFPGAAPFSAAYLPGIATLSPSQPTTVVVDAYGSLAAGTYTEVVNFQFSDGHVQPVKVHVIASAPSASTATSVTNGKARPLPAAPCVPSKLIPALTTLSPAFAVSAGYPTALSVQVLDNCGNPHVTGGVTVSFTDGDPELALSSLNNGIWQATWAAGTQSSGQSVSLNIAAVNPVLQITGALEVDGGVGTAKSPPMVTPGGVVSAASPVSYTALAPGSIISIYGSLLSDSPNAAQSIPLPTTMGNTTVRIGGMIAPLFYASDGQINAVVPFGLNTNTPQQIYIQRDATVSSPVSVNIADAQPGAFVYSGGAIVEDYRNPAAPFLVSPSAPAQAGDVLVFYCGGLGLATQAVADGAASPSVQTKATVTATIGKQPANVLYSGLVQGFVGLYQVNLVMPAGVTPGSATAVTLTAAGQTSPVASIATQ